MRIPRLLAAAALSAAVLTLCACAGTVGLANGDPGRDTSPPPPPQMAPTPDVTVAAPAAPVAATPGAPGAVSAVTVTFSDQMEQLAAADPRLNTADIAAAVENELAAHQLYEPALAGLHRTLSITIANYTNSLASNASVLGFSFRSAALTGDVQVLGDPAMAGTFDVHARSRLTSREAGAEAGSLTGLYKRFAVLTVSALRGVAAPEEAAPR